ncbi:MAG: nicotinate-nucleotide--dimethylbenzimidazole phosphoribosyltransferase [Deltaproteobacteria bacterium]
MKSIEDVLALIRPLDEVWLERARERLDSLTKPKGSLGRLEEIAAQIVSVREEARPNLARKVIFTFACDHGVTEERVSAFPREVTSQMVLNFLRGGAGINALARHAGADVVVVDMGVDHDFAGIEGLIHRKVVSGTGNIARGPAMTRDQAVRCVEVGIELAGGYANAGYALFGTGDMGIGNTTPSSAIIACLSGLPAREVTGRGTGVDDETFERKVKAIERALKVNAPAPGDPVEVLARVGGAEIGGIAGLCLGAAAKRVPVLVDGFISTAGALLACEIEPKVKQYLIPSHMSMERGHRAMLERMGLRPLLDLDLRLGEGTGAAIAMLVVTAALRAYNEMATFAEASVAGEVERVATMQRS